MISDMWQGDDSLAWITLAQAPGRSVGMLSCALDSLEVPRALLYASDTLYEHADLPRETHAAAERGESARRWRKDARHNLILFAHPRYRSSLNILVGRPIAFRVSGPFKAARSR